MSKHNDTKAQADRFLATLRQQLTQPMVLVLNDKLPEHAVVSDPVMTINVRETVQAWPAAIRARITGANRH